MRRVASLDSIKAAKKHLIAFNKSLEKVPYDEMQYSATRLYPQIIAKTPLKTGKLERSVYVRVSKDKRRPSLLVGAVAFNGKRYDYAVIQHENPEFHHPIRGEAYYILNPFLSEIDAYIKRVSGKLG